MINTTSYHMSFAIRYFNRLENSELVKAFIGKNRAEKIRAHLMALRAKGYDFVPPCDKIEKDGSCAGHREAPESVQVGK